ncbi:MAG: chromate efflux transporter [Chitinophagales bacterium]|nr:chromate efflux transporter [Hyphomicrobiales bacterium]
MFWISLRLGLTSFGGPIAHLAYFRDEFVVRRRWFDEETYADLVALSQFVPGPASSQTLYAIGLLKGDQLGGMAAWLGFTLPSALLMLAAAYGLQFATGATAQGLIHGLKIVAVAVVTQAVWSMAKSLCPDRTRAGISIAAAALLVAAPSTAAQLAVIGSGALAGWLLLKPRANNRQLAYTGGPSRAAGMFALLLFTLILLGLPVMLGFLPSGELAAFEAFYRAGALVFGGGHVVLPLLQEAVVSSGQMTREAFLAGYGAAQALPGPLFTFAAYLGALLPTGLGPIGGAALCIVAIFLPGLLLIYGALPFWAELRQRTGARAVLGGINATVVGVLAAALYDPIAVSAITKPADLSLALLALGALMVLRAPILAVVAATASGGVLLTF